MAVSYGPWTTPPPQTLGIPDDGSAPGPGNTGWGRLDIATISPVNLAEPTGSQLLDLSASIAHGTLVTAKDHLDIEFEGGQGVGTDVVKHGLASHPLGGDAVFTQQMAVAAALMPLPLTWYPPGWDDDPHVVDIEFRGDNTYIDSWVVLASWWDDPNSSSAISGYPLIVTRLAAAEEGVWFDYSGGTFVDVIGPPAGTGLAGYPLGDIPAPTTPAGGLWPDHPASAPQLNSWHFGDPSSLVTSRQHLLIAVYTGIHIDGFATDWPTSVDENADYIRSYRAVVLAQAGILYQPQDYRLVYDIVAPQRQFPRDDGLAISTRRFYPPPTSKQFGNRRGPASTYV